SVGVLVIILVIIVRQAFTLPCRSEKPVPIMVALALGHLWAGNNSISPPISVVTQGTAFLLFLQHYSKWRNGDNDGSASHRILHGDCDRLFILDSRPPHKVIASSKHR